MDAETDRDTPLPAADAKPVRSLGPLRMIWSAAIAYPGRVATALAALTVTAAATLGIPWGFSQIIDKGFARGSDPATVEHWFFMLLGIVAVLAIGTAVRFYSVSWLGERVVADIRLAVQNNLLRLAPASSRKTAPRKSPAA